MNVSQTLDAINALWFEAGSLNDEAAFLEDAASEKRSRAGELDDAAEELWKPLAELNPEWRDAFIERVDPRTTPPEEGDMK